VIPKARAEPRSPLSARIFRRVAWWPQAQQSEGASAPGLTIPAMGFRRCILKPRPGRRSLSEPGTP